MAAKIDLRDPSLRFTFESINQPLFEEAHTAMQTPYRTDKVLEEMGDKKFDGKELNLVIADELTLAGHTFSPKALRGPLVLREDLGVVQGSSYALERLHGWPTPYAFADSPKAVRTPKGDILVGFPSGFSIYLRSRFQSERHVLYALLRQWQDVVGAVFGLENGI